MRSRTLAIVAAVALGAAAAPLAWSGGTEIRSAAAHADECGCGGGRHGGGGHGGAGSAMGGAGGSSTEQHAGGVHPGADQVPGGITDHEADLGDGGNEGHSGSGGHKGMGGRAGGSHGSAHAASAEEQAAQHVKVEGAGHAGGRGREAASRGRGEIAGGGGTDVWGPGASHAGGDAAHVELGRLNVAHAPSSVFDRAVGEALSGLSPQAKALYSLPFDQALAQLSTLPEEARVEGPLQNLALYRALMEGRSLPLQPSDPLDTAALFLGSAAGGEAALDAAAVRAVNALLGVGRMDQATLESLAARAERVREALTAGHEDHNDGEQGGPEGGAGGHVP